MHELWKVVTGRENDKGEAARGTEKAIGKMEEPGRKTGKKMSKYENVHELGVQKYGRRMYVFRNYQFSDIWQKVSTP